MSTALTDVEKIRRLPWLIAGDTLNIIFVTLTFAGPVFIFFLDELVGQRPNRLLLSLIPFAVGRAVDCPVGDRLGYKRVFVTFWGIRKFVFALLLWTPAFLLALAPNPLYLGSAIILALPCAAPSPNGRLPWQQEVVPTDTRQNQRLSSISTHRRDCGHSGQALSSARTV